MSVPTSDQWKAVLLHMLRSGIVNQGQPDDDCERRKHSCPPEKGDGPAAIGAF